MIRAHVLALMLCPVLLLCPGRARAQVCGNAPDMLIVLDRSGSMSSYSKWSEATSAVNQLASLYDTQIQFGLMLFPGPCGICCGGQIDVPLGLSASNAIKAKLSSTSPTGNTPMAASLQNAFNYLKNMHPTKIKYVLLVTDGMPNCTPSDPLPWVQSLAGAGIKTYVVGFGTGVSSSQLNALAAAGGTALSGSIQYYQANNSTQLSAAFKAIGNQVACCGNGKKESWEKCEKSLPAGAAGACPVSAASCPKKICFSPYLTGTECNVSCAYKPVTQPITGDGCCPPGANYNNDKDCKVNCGNGVLEANELCDPGIKSGPGKCKTLADCTDNLPCTKDEVVGGACHRVCQRSQLSIEQGVKDGCCPAGKTSIDDADCPPPCGPDKTKNCIDPCKGVTCPNGYICYYGACKPKTNVGASDGGMGSGGDGEISTGYDDDPTAAISGTGCACQAGGPAAAAGWWPALALLLLALGAARSRRR